MPRSVFKFLRPLKSWRVGLGVLASALILTPAIPSARADLWNQRTVVTFNEPVEVPGAVLGPGTYVFKLANVQDRDIVQILNQRETRVIASEITVPALRATPAGKTIITFEERGGNSPDAVHDWYYPGTIYGHQFIYNR